MNKLQEYSLVNLSPKLVLCLFVVWCSVVLNISLFTSSNAILATDECNGWDVVMNGTTSVTKSNLRYVVDKNGCYHSN